MNRKEYEAKRKANRASAETREERGLAPHPDGTGCRACSDCNGAGETYGNSSYNNNPEFGYEMPCYTCHQTGLVNDGRGPDLLLVMQKYRKWIHLKGNDFIYRSARRRAMMPVAGLAQATMLALACRIQTSAENLRELMG